MNKFKILLFTLFFLSFFSYSYAIDVGVYYNGDSSISATVTGDNIVLYDEINEVTLNNVTLPTGKMATAKVINIGKNTGATSAALFFVDNNNVATWRYNNAWNTSSYSWATFNSLILMDSGINYGYSTYALGYTQNVNDSKFISYNGGSLGSVNLSVYSSNIVSSVPFDGQIVYKDEILSSGTPLFCTTEDIPFYDFIDLQPTSTGSISEYIEDPANYTYAYSTSLSGENPLQVIALGIDNESGFSDFSFSNGPFTFSTLNNTVFSDDETFLSVSAKNGVDFLKLQGDYGDVDIITYREDNRTIHNIYKNIDLNSYNTGYGFPTGSKGQVVIVFKNSFFQNEINSIEIYSIGSDNTQEIEICYDEDNDLYEVDGTEWEGLNDPYTNLVGSATATGTTLTNGGYTFFANGFCLNNFTPFPSGGDLFFEIQKPDLTLEKTYIISSSGLYRYGSNTCTPITTNYHNITGKYYVKGYYLYNGVIYEVNENFTPYDIINPEFIESNNQNIWSQEQTACGVTGNETGFLPGVSRFFACASETIANFFSNQYEAVKNVGGFILKMSDIFSTEIKDFSFISGAFAYDPLSEIMDFTEPEGFNDTPYGKLKNLLWGVIATMLVVVSIGIIIYIKQND